MFDELANIALTIGIARGFHLRAWFVPRLTRDLRIREQEGAQVQYVPQKDQHTVSS